MWRVRLPAALAWVSLLTGAGLWSPGPANAAEPTAQIALALQPPEAWSPRERAAVAALLARLPNALRAHGPSSIVRDAVACDAEGWPEDDALVDRSNRVHLCFDRALEPGVIAGQVAVAWLLVFDRTAGWSTDPGWLRLNGWRSSLTAGFTARAENTDLAGFASPRGRRSPRWDLATFMAAWLLDPARDGGGIGCRLLSQARFVARRLGGDAPTSPRCEAFEAWADLDRLDSVEAVLAAPSTAMVGSLFGHLLMRLVYRDADGRTPPHLSRTIAFLADNEVPFEEDPTYAFKGIAGRYLASLHEHPFLDTYREYVVIEGRDLRRWRLNLTETQRRALLERIWTVAHGGHYAYYFFRRNCATLMVDLVDDILPPAHNAGVTGWLAAPPASTLEPWQREVGTDGRPLLEFVDEPILSFDHQARLTSHHRRSIEAHFGAHLGQAEAAALKRALRDSHSEEAAVRSSAYGQLATLLADERAGAAAEVRAWLRDSTVIESYLSTLANEQAEARAERTRRVRIRVAAGDLIAELHLDASRLSAARPEGDRGIRLEGALRDVESSESARRLAGYGALADLASSFGTTRVANDIRRLALLVSEARYDVDRMKEVAGLRDALLFVDADKPIDEQPYVIGYEDLVRTPVETRISRPLRSLQRAKQALFAERIPDGAPSSAGGEHDGPNLQRDYEASLARSGIDQLAVLGGVTVSPGATPVGGLVLAGALYDERLGDHRRFGFPSDTALVVGRSSALMSAADGMPLVTRYDTEAFGYRSLRLPLPEAGGASWPIGWETYANVSGSRARQLDAEVKIGWGMLGQVVQRNDLRDHLLVGLGLAYDGYFASSAAPRSGRPQAIAVPLSLELRAGIGAEPRYRSWLAVRVWGQPIVPFAGTPWTPRREVGLQAEAHLALPMRTARTSHDPALLFQGQIKRADITFSGDADLVEAFGAVGIEYR
jgi:hypothetical protein